MAGEGPAVHRTQRCRDWFYSVGNYARDKVNIKKQVTNQPGRNRRSRHVLAGLAVAAPPWVLWSHAAAASVRLSVRHGLSAELWKGGPVGTHPVGRKQKPTQGGVAPELRVEMECCEMSDPRLCKEGQLQAVPRVNNKTLFCLPAPAGGSWEGRGGSRPPLEEGPVLGAPRAPGAHRAILTEPRGLGQDPSSRS